MKLTERTKSPEPCTEAGWTAWQYHLDGPLDEPFILGLRPLGGSYLFLRKLSRPFFKIESDYYLIKGLLGDTSFRVAVHRDHEDELRRIEAFVRSLLA